MRHPLWGGLQPAAGFSPLRLSGTNSPAQAKAFQLRAESCLNERILLQA
jgi:hypothetical protein